MAQPILRFVFTIIAAVGIAILWFFSFQNAVWADDKPKRVVAIGGSVTEIIYALGEQDRLIARDATSVFPKQATELPSVGYIRRLSPEGVLSVDPDLIIALDGAGPPEAVDVLNSAGISLRTIPEVYNKKGIIAKIESVGDALGASDKAKAIIASVEKDFDQLAKTTARLNTKKRVLFVLSAASGKILSSGTNTAANAIIELAGGENIITAFEGYKALSDEAIITAAPDVILMMDRGGNHAIDDEALLKHPAVALTPAARTKSIVRMDGLYLLGFGPRTARAALELSEALYAQETQ
ncbi:MAG: ABC transporter substrate-binding protein [Pseudomonadota bacterium]